MDLFDELTTILVAVKEDDKLKSKLIEICSLPRQQRVVEINTYLYEKSDELSIDMEFIKAIRTLSDDDIASQALKYLRA